jgi:hypothetical protein
LKTEYNAWVKTSSEPGKDLQTDIPNRSKPNAEVIPKFLFLHGYLVCPLSLNHLNLKPL